MPPPWLSFAAVVNSFAHKPSGLARGKVRARGRYPAAKGENNEADVVPPDAVYRAAGKLPRKHPSVWVDIHSSLFDPKRAHLMYNDFMDELEYAAECGFDAICVNEHHSNGYGLMPSPNLIASSLARRTTDTALCVMGNSLALYNPPTRVAEEFAMIDVISGGRLIAGFPVGTPMDTCYAYGQNPVELRERYLEAHDLVAARLDRTRTPSRSTAASTSSATSTSGRARCSSRIRRSGSPAAARSRPGAGAPRWTTSTATCPTTATRSARRRWTGSGPKWTALARTATHIARASCNSSASAEIRQHAMDLYRTGRGIFLRPLPAYRSALGRPAGLRHGGNQRAGHGKPVSKAAEYTEKFNTLGPRNGCDRRQRLRHHRLPR